MGIFASLAGLPRGSGLTLQPVHLLKGEMATAQVFASIRPGTPTSVRGDLIVTPIRVLFAPLDERDLSEALKWGFRRESGAAVNPLIDHTVRLTGDHVDTADGLAGVAAVHVGPPASFRSPPTLLLKGTDETLTEIGITHTRVSARFDRYNNIARDWIVAAIQKQLAQPGGLPDRLL